MPTQDEPDQKQRALFFALLQDIWRWSGEPVDWLKEYFYARYTIRTQGDEISSANGTSNSVTEARYLLDDVVKFIFEYDVPIRSGYMLYRERKATSNTNVSSTVNA